MFLHPNSAPLWREYLLFTQSYFSNFTVPKVNAAYGKCLSTLSAVRDGSMVSHPALPGIEEDMLGNKSHPVFLLWMYWWGDNSYIFSYSAQFLSSPASVTFVCLQQHFRMYAQCWLKVVGVISFCSDIFTQQCHFLRQCGHSEKAISMFQAMIDFTFFKPDSVQKLPTKQQVNTHTVDHYTDIRFLSTQCEWYWK